MYAHITDGAIDPATIGALPRLWWDGSRWWDWRTDTTTATARGWLPVVEVPRPPDTATTTSNPAPVALVAGVPTQQWTVRPWTAGELAWKAENAARLDSVEDRLARIEAKLWPPQPDTTPSKDVPTLAAYGGVWPAGALLTDSGKTWRNVAGVPLTTAPSGFPGTAGQWVHLFVLAAAATQPAPAVPEWSATATYAVGDKATRGGITYRCLVAHGAAYAGTWGPPLASVWAVV